MMTVWKKTSDPSEYVAHFDKLRSDLIAAIKAAFFEALARFPDEEICSFALFADKVGIGFDTVLYPVFNTQEHLEANIANHPNEKMYYTYNTHEWCCNFVAQDQFQQLNHQIIEGFRHDRFINDLFILCNACLVSLKKDHFFRDTLGQDILLLFDVSNYWWRAEDDWGPEWIITDHYAWMKQLNNDVVANDFQVVKQVVFDLESSTDFARLRVAIMEGIRISVRDILEKYPKEEICSLALFTDGDGVTLSLMINTFQHLQKVLANANTRDLQFYYTYACVEWDADISELAFNDVFAQICSDLNYITDHRTDPVHLKKLSLLCNECLYQLKEEGFFKAVFGRDIYLSFEIGDYDLDVSDDSPLGHWNIDGQMVWLKRLNPEDEELLNNFRRVMLGD